MNKDIENKAFDAQTLKKIYEMHEEETISDEEVQRVLEPVLAMIKEGKFDTPRRLYARILPLATVAAVLVVTATVTMVRSGIVNDPITEIEDTRPPLFETIPVYRSISGRIVLEGESLDGVVVVIVDAERLIDIGTAITDREGVFVFNNLPNGTYRIKAALAEGMRIVDEPDSDGWIKVNGSVDLVINDDSENIWDIGDIYLGRD